MPFEFKRLDLPEVVLVEPRVFPDDRGFFMETYRRSEFVSYGIAETFVQTNHSHSAFGTIRGLHFQKAPKAQGKLIRVVRGCVLDVIVDIRKGSPRFARWVALELSAENRKMVYVPPGFAHGACMISDKVDLLYMVTQEYAPTEERGIRWNDPTLAIKWPLDSPLLSAKDKSWPILSLADNNFEYSSQR